MAGDRWPRSPAGARIIGRPGARDIGLGSVAIAAGLLLLTQGRSDVASAGIPLDTPNPVPLTNQAVEVGKNAFQANCIACHGVGGGG